MNVSRKQSCGSIDGQPWHVVKMIIILQEKKEKERKNDPYLRYSQQSLSGHVLHREKFVRFSNLFIAYSLHAFDYTFHCTHFGVFSF